MTLEQRIAAIVAQDCLTPTERAAAILANPDIRQGLALVELQRKIRRRIEVIRQSEGGTHGRPAA